MSNKLKGSIMLLITALIWGSAFVAQSKGMDHLGPFAYNMCRTLLGAMVLLPVMAVLKKAGIGGNNDKAVVRQSIIGGLSCGAVFFAASSLQQYGISLTTAGKAGFITALYIVIVPLLGLFIKQRPPKLIWLCILLAVGGFYLLCIKSGFSVSGGDLAVLMCSVLFALHIIFIDRFTAKGTDAALLSFVQFLTAGVMMLVCAFIFEEPTVANIRAAWAPILYGGVLSCGVAYTLQVFGQKYTEPTVATLIMSLESVFAALSGWLILGERLSPRELAGCVLVFAAVIMAQLVSSGKNKE